MNNYYAEKEADYYGHARLDVLDLLPLHTETLLDVGCGAGATARVARERGVREITGIELFEEAAAHAQPHVDHLHVGDVTVILPDLPASHYDVILCADVLEHTTDPWAVLRQMRALLRDGGVVIASLPNLQFHRALRRIATNRFEYEEQGIFDRTHFRFFTRHTMVRLFEESGYEVLHVAPNIYGKKHQLAERLSFHLLTPFLALQYRLVARPRSDTP